MNKIIKFPLDINNYSCQFGVLLCNNCDQLPKDPYELEQFDGECEKCYRMAHAEALLDARKYE